MNTIHFKDVGRGKAQWSQQFPAITEDAIVKAIRRKGALMSSDIDVEMSDNNLTGVIIVGGWRAVGGFTVESNQKTEAKQ